MHTYMRVRISWECTSPTTKETPKMRRKRHRRASFGPASLHLAEFAFVGYKKAAVCVACARAVPRRSALPQTHVHTIRATWCRATLWCNMVRCATCTSTDLAPKTPCAQYEAPSLRRSSVSECASICLQTFVCDGMHGCKGGYAWVQGGYA
jgi:hypothetical protein